MLNLVIKDLQLSLKTNIFIVVSTLFISLIGISAAHLAEEVLYIFAITMIINITVLDTNGYDQKNKSEIIFNSLPIDRNELVKAKYLTLLIYIVFWSGSLVLFTNLLKIFFPQLEGNPTSIWNCMLATDLLLLFYSFYYPIYFKVGEGMRTSNHIMYILVFIVPTFINKLGKRPETKELLKKLATINFNKIYICTLILGLGLYWLSLQLSKKIYMKREF